MLSNQVIDYYPCPKCREDGRDNSGDNLAVYADGHGKCWAGHGFFPPKILENILKEYNTKSNNTLSNNTYRRTSYRMVLENTIVTSSPPTSIPPIVPPSSFSQCDDLDYREWRGITVETMKFFKVQSNDELIIYPWGPNAQQVRRKDQKVFWWEGQAKDSQGLFGMDRFVSGHNFVVTITEGALDAMSLWQALGGKYAVVSVKSAPSALADCTREFQFLNSYDKIKLAFDNDKPGQDAAQQVARLFDVNKVYWVKP